MTKYDKDMCAICLEQTFCQSANCNHFICSSCYSDYISHSGNMIVVDELYNYSVSIKCPTCRNPDMGDNICRDINLYDLFNISTNVVLFLNRKIDSLLLTDIPINDYVEWVKKYHSVKNEFSDKIKTDIRYSF